MISVLFFTETNWAFGSIHKALCKRMFNYGINAHILNWEVPYSSEEFSLMNERHDYFSTTPESIEIFFRNNISLEKVVVVGHGSQSLNHAVSVYGVDVFDQLKEYAVNNESLILLSKQLGIRRVPKLVTVGIDTDYFSSSYSSQLRTLGYAGTKCHILSGGIECKRTYLVDRVASITGLPLIYPSKKMVHMSMPGFYRKMDCLICSSLEETAGIPAMEAASSGKLVLSTKVGYFNEGCGVVCSMDENQFVIDAKEAIDLYRDPVLYRAKCQQISEYARSHYDWKFHILPWVKLYM